MIGRARESSSRTVYSLLLKPIRRCRLNEVYFPVFRRPVGVMVHLHQRRDSEPLNPRRHNNNVQSSTVVQPKPTQHVSPRKSTYILSEGTRKRSDLLRATVLITALFSRTDCDDTCRRVPDHSSSQDNIRMPNSNLDDIRPLKLVRVVDPSAVCFPMEQAK